MLAALTDWPRTAEAAPADPTVLPQFLNDLLWELPWWNRDWRVTHVGHAHPCETPSNESPAGTKPIEVFVAGMAGDGDGKAVPFSARVRFAGDRLIRLQAKIGDTVIGPGITAPGRLEPHPFGPVFSRLMELRGISVGEMARQCGRAESTIMKLRHGRLTPHRALVAEVAEALKMSEADVAAIAGLEQDVPATR